MTEKVSIVIRARQEYPIILGTINSILEDVEYSKIPYEFIIVPNGSTDLLAECLYDRYRRWLRAGLLKVVEYTGTPNTWLAINAGWKAATGDVLAVADAHITVKIGTMAALVNGAREVGGIHHAAVNKWGDLDHIKSYGYDMTLASNFWGGACRFAPPDVDPTKRWPIAMAGACLYAARRDEIDRYGLYPDMIKAYGGGEPYLCFKWWMLGSKVWIEPETLCSHAFGIGHRWVKATKDQRLRLEVYKRDGTITRFVKKGDEYLGYSSGYTVPNDDFYFNFLLASYLIGGEAWLEKLKASFARKCKRVEALAKEVVESGKEHREWIAKNAKYTLDQLLAAPPWKNCGVHKSMDMKAETDEEIAEDTSVRDEKEVEHESTEEIPAGEAVAEQEAADAEDAGRGDGNDPKTA